MIALSGHAYSILAGLLLLLGATLTVLKRTADTRDNRYVGPRPIAATGAAAGLISGLTGVGGGVFLAPVLIAAGWASPIWVAALSPPFILCNSVAALAGVHIAGQTLALGAFLYLAAALVGAIAGSRMRCSHCPRCAGC
jgi:uncharacterized protein